MYEKELCPRYDPGTGAGYAAVLVACGGKQSICHKPKPTQSAENGGSTEATATAYKDTLIWAQGADVTSLDPHQGKETPAVEVTCQIFDTLVTADAETNEIVPQIAESWEQTDAQTYVFKIRQGIKFHDGSDLTAEDVKFSWIVLATRSCLLYRQLY